MAKHRSIIAVEHDEGQEARVTLGPASADDQSWFRLFRGIVRTGVWADMGAGARSVLVVLAEAVNDQIRREGGQWLAWPSVPTIAKRAGLAERNVYVALRELQSKDLIRKIAPGGGRRQTTYEVRAPKTTGEPGESRPMTPTSGVIYPSGVSGASRQPRRGRHGTPDPRVTQQRKSQSRSNDSSSAGHGSEASAALAEAGVVEPTLSRLVADHAAEELLLRLRDWRNRTAAGGKLGVAWLVASIRHHYDLHETTRAELDRRDRDAAATAHRLRAIEAEAAEERRQRAIDEQVTAKFDAMSDEELGHWKGVVVAEFPSLIRNPDRADPKTHDRLRRLILGKLAHLVAPSETDPTARRRR